MALVIGLWLLNRIRDWRFGTLVVMVGFMAWRQVLTLLAGGMGPLEWSPTAELPGLIVSIMVIVAIATLGRVIEHDRASARASAVAARTLAGERARFRFIVESSHDVTVLLSRDGTITHVTDGIADVLGVAADTVVGTNMHDAAEHPDDLDARRRQFDAVLAAPGMPITARRRAQHADQRWRWIEYRMVNHLDDPDLRAVVAHYHDVTDEVEASASERRLAAIVEASDDLVGYADMKQRVQYLNRRARVAMELAPGDEVTDFTIREFLEPESYDRIRQALPAIAAGESWAGETVWRTRSGMGVPVSEILFPVPGTHGDVEFVATIARDLRPRIALEARAGALLERARDAVAVLDAEGCVTYVSPPVERILGFPPEHFMGSRFGGAVLDEGDLALVTRTFEHVLSAAGAAGQFQVWVGHQNGSKRRLDAVMVNRLDDTEIHGVIVNFRDVTDEWNAQGELRRLATLLDATTDMVAIVDLEQNVVYINAARRRALGLSADADVTGTRLRDYATDATLATMQQEAIPKALRGEVWQGETVWRTHDGGLVPVWQVVFALPGEDGKPAYLASTARDLTERRAAEAALRKGEQDYRQLFEEAGDGMLLTRGDTSIVDVSRQFCAMVGMAKADLIGTSTTDFLLQNDSAGKNPEDALRQLEAGAAVRGDYRVRHASGRWIHVDVSMRKIGPDRYLNVVRDLTARVAAEAQSAAASALVERMLRTLQDGYLLASTDGQILDANQAYCELTGYTLEELTQRNIRDIEAQLDTAQVQARIAAMQRDGGARFETRHRRKDGRLRDLEVSAVVVDVGDQPAVAAFLRDVTEARKARGVLQESHARLRALAQRLQTIREDERTSVAREIHDELGQLLTGARTETSALLSALPSSARGLRARARSITDVLDDSIDAVRDLATRLRPAALDDLGLVDALEMHLERAAERAGLLLALDCRIGPTEPSGPVALTVFRVAQELMTNVIRHAGAANVDAALREEDGWLVLTLTDDGRGLPEGRFDAAGSLGILGMRERASALGGTMDVRRAPAGGTVATLRIPLSPP